MAGNGKDNNALAALTGKGKGKGQKGKHGKSRYKEGYGKGNDNWYSSPGKAIGKGGVHHCGSEDEYWSAWGYDGDSWNHGNDYGDYNNHYIGNVMMMLENATKQQCCNSKIQQGTEMPRFTHCASQIDISS